MTYYCRKCATRKPDTDFYVHSLRVHDYTCKRCMPDAQREPRELVGSWLLRLYQSTYPPVSSSK